MSMRRKTFSAKKSGTDDVVILDLEDPNGNAVSFRCNSKIPGMVLVDFISEMDEDKPAAVGGMLQGLFKHAIAEDEYERFTEYVRDIKNEVDLEMLSEMAGWLAEQYSGNPTMSSSSSTNGSSTTGFGASDVPAELAAISGR